MLSAEGLLATARAACSRAYAPYSDFRVGAALLTAEGQIFTGANIENSSYGLSVCAERVALFNAVHAGKGNIIRLALAADSSTPPLPCGPCLQVMAEHGQDLEIIAGNFRGQILKRRLGDLLPEPFIMALHGADSKPPPEENWRLTLSFRPVGFVSNDYHAPSSVPGGYREKLSRIIIDQDLVDGLYRLEEEKKIIVIGYLHLAPAAVLKGERRGRADGVYGVFACRAPGRPNPVSHSEVNLLERRGNVLTVKGLDLINGTPVLDIKTVIGENNK